MIELLPPDCAGPDRYLVELAFDETTSVPEDVLAHITGCARCTEALSALRGVRDSMGHLPLEAPSEAMDDRILAALDTQLAGGDVSAFMRLPEPEIALGAKRLTALLSQPPAARSLRAVEGPSRSAASSSAAESKPGPAHARPARRRWPAAMMAAASFVVVAGGTLYLSQEGGSPVMLAGSAKHAEPVDAVTTGESPKAAAAPATPAVTAQASKAGASPAKNRGVRSELCNGLDGDCDGVAGAESGGHNTTRTPEKPAHPSPDNARLAKKASRAPADAPAGRALGGFFGTPAESSDNAPAQREAATRAASAEEAERHASLERAKDEQTAAPAASGGFAQRIQKPMASTVTDESFAPPPAVAAQSALVPAAGPRPPPPTVLADRDSANEKSDKEAVDWAVPMSQARAAARRGDNRIAAAEFALVAGFSDTPSAVVREALEGRIQSLLALNRLDDAQAAADQLAKRFPALADAREKVRRAKAMANRPAAAAKAADMMAAPAEAPAATPPPAAIDAK